jgi:penicillin-binding protein 1A
LHDWQSNNNRKKRLVDWLGIDSWIDSQLATTWQNFRDRWSAASSFFARFRLTGWKRATNELLSEGLTLGTAGLIGLYALAIPALVEFDESKITQSKYAVKFLDRYGNEIGKRGILHSDAVPLEEYPENMIRALLATEDRRFYDHFGVDFIGTFRALVTNLNAGETVQGGSTLTQQLAKNLFLTNERSIERKIKELFLAFLLESRFSKRDIMKMYLDRAYMGGGAFGAEAAAQFYFGKSIREVTLPEAAMLAGLFKAPTKFAPHVNIALARARANEVLSNLVEAGYMTAGQVHAARINPARPIENRQNASPDWFLDWAFDEVQRIAEGRGVFSLTVRTTVDMSLQASADDALQTVIRQFGRSHNARSGSVVTMEPDGAVRALVGGLDYGESQFNRATNARRQPGSSFKLYVYAAALENGFTVNSSVSDTPVSCGNWAPKNYDGTSGSGRSVSLRDAFKVSLNTTAVDLSLNRLGPTSRDKVIEMTERLGVRGVKKSCSMALGDTGISPIEHTGAYAVFANNGKLAKPYAVIEMFNARGDLVWSRERDEPPAPQVMRPRVAQEMNQMMQAVVTEGTGRRATLDFTHAVGKTGTSSSYRDAWFMGFTGQYVTGVWIGNDDYRPMLIEAASRGTAQGVTGGNLPAMVWQALNSVAHQNMAIPTIPGLQPHPRQVQEQQRLADLRRTDPALAAAQSQPTQRRDGIMPDKTRDVLKSLVESMRRVAAALDQPAEPQAPAAPRAQAPEPAPAPAQPSNQPANVQPAPRPADKRAEGPGAAAPSNVR